MDEALLRKAIGLWIRRKGHVRRYRIRLLAVATIVVVAGMLIMLLLVRRLPIELAVVPLIVAGLVLFSALRIPRRLTSAYMKAFEFPRNPALLGDHLLEITERTFRRSNEHYEAAMRLESMTAVHRFPDILLLEPSPNSFFPLPASADYGVNSFEAVAEYLSQRVGQA